MTQQSINGQGKGDVITKLTVFRRNGSFRDSSSVATERTACHMLRICMASRRYGCGSDFLSRRLWQRPDHISNICSSSRRCAIFCATISWNISRTIRRKCYSETVSVVPVDQLSMASVPQYILHRNHYIYCILSQQLNCVSLPDSSPAICDRLDYVDANALHLTIHWTLLSLALCYFVNQSNPSSHFGRWVFRSFRIWRLRRAPQIFGWPFDGLGYAWHCHCLYNSRSELTLDLFALYWWVWASRRLCTLLICRAPLSWLL